MFHSRILRYLDEVVRSGSIRQAAEKLNIASSAINRQILMLEEELGTPVFERLPRGLRLTSAGELLIGHVRQTLRDHDRVHSRILQLKGLQRGTVKIATMNGLASGFLPRLAIDFRHKYPGVKIIIQSLVAEAIQKTVEEGEVDCGLGYNLRSDPSLHVIEIFNARLGAIVSPTHPLARQRNVRLADCSAHPIVLGDRTLSIHGMVTNAFKRSNLTSQPTYETNSIEMMKYVARHDNAITFLSAPDVSEETSAGLLVYLPILDRSLNTNPLTLVQRGNSSLELAPSLFVEELRTSLRGLTRQSNVTPDRGLPRNRGKR